MSVVLGGLIVAVKGLAIGAAGFGLAWWRGRLRIRQLEAELADQTAEAERLAAIHADLSRQLPPAP